MKNPKAFLAIGRHMFVIDIAIFFWNRKHKSLRLLFWFGAIVFLFMAWPVQEPLYQEQFEFGKHMYLQNRCNVINLVAWKIQLTLLCFFKMRFLFGFCKKGHTHTHIGAWNDFLNLELWVLRFSNCYTIRLSDSQISDSYSFICSVDGAGSSGLSRAPGVARLRLPKAKTDPESGDGHRATRHIIEK